MDEQRIDQVIDALERDEIERAAVLVRNATGANDRQAMEVVLTFLEGLEDAEGRGLQF